jgi:D-sedoheptulose 7-phosphate isomerase
MARFDLDQFIASEFDEHEAVLRDSRKAVADEFRKLVAAAVACLKGGGKILFFGNGGSAGDAHSRRS